MHVARRGAKAPVQRITSAAPPHSEDIAWRQKRYIIQMSIRAVCFMLAVVVPGPMRYVLLLAAVVLPYVAVVGANAGRGNLQTPPDSLMSDAPPHEPPALGPGRSGTLS
jgi:Protein of unknown function (DUF3099)